MPMNILEIRKEMIFRSALYHSRWTSHSWISFSVFNEKAVLVSFPNVLEANSRAGSIVEKMMGIHYDTILVVHILELLRPKIDLILF